MSKILIKNVKKAFGKKQILKGVNLALETGKVYGLLGNNGAGKTTLMRSVFNMVRPDSGTITFDGVPQKDVDYKDWFYFTETDSLPLRMSCKEYLESIASLAKLSDEEYEARLKEANEIIHPDFPLTNKISGLSSGQQKLLGCMAVLIIKPRIVFLDEPTANMDVKNQMVVLNMVRTLASQDRLVVIITHLIKEVDEVLTDVVILDDGKIKYNKPHKKGEDLNKIFLKYTSPSKLDLNRMEKYLNE